MTTWVWSVGIYDIQVNVLQLSECTVLNDDGKQGLYSNTQN